MMTQPMPSQPLSGAHYKGFTILHLRTYVLQNHGEEALQEVIASLPPPMRGYYAHNQVLAIAQVPAEAYFDAVTLVVERFYGGVAREAQRIGFATAGMDIGAFFKALISFASPQLVLGMAGRLWGRYCDKGAMKFVSTGPNTGTVEISGFPLAHNPIVANELAGGMLAYLTYSKAQSPTVRSIEMPSPGTLLTHLSF